VAKLEAQREALDTKHARERERLSKALEAARRALS
jgi:hypothetical protein